jgi:glycosyltransferase involved in cell wall biosynthesis
MKPLFSIIIPVYNRRHMVAATIRSALTAAGELPPGTCEIIAIDDGSTDGSIETLRSFEPAVRVIQQTNQGGGAAKNTGARAATGSYILTLDSDDALLPGALPLVASLIARTTTPTTSPALIAGRGITFADDVELSTLLGTPAPQGAAAGLRYEQFDCLWASNAQGFASIPSATFIRTDAYLACDGSASHRNNATDQNLWMGIGHVASYVRIDEPPLCALRRGHESMVSNHARSTLGWLYVAQREAAGHYGAPRWAPQRRRYIARCVRQFLSLPHRGGPRGPAFRLFLAVLPWLISSRKFGFILRWPLQRLFTPSSASTPSAPEKAANPAQASTS